MQNENDNTPRKKVKLFPRLIRGGSNHGKPVNTSDTSIYVVAEKNFIVCKIGISSNPSARLSELQVGNSRVLHLAYTCNKLERWTACSIERSTHKRLAEFRKMGEWFGVEVEVAVRTIKDELTRHGLSYTVVPKKEEPPLLPDVEWRP